MRHPEAFASVAREMKYDLDADVRAARLLANLLPADHPATWNDLRRLFRRRVVRVFGAGPNLDQADRAGLARNCDVVVAADGATSFLVRRGVVPHVIVTDLDGHVPDQVAANARGSVLMVHAHGDNLAELARWVPSFPGRVCGTSQVEGIAGVPYVGGFTDGDRCAFLATGFGASRVETVGFDFSAAASPYSKPPSAAKRRKFALAAHLLDGLRREANVVDVAPASL